ncbi:MAG: hypothetical protein VYD19_01210 [Myxococcota bacterium]|nr:hypothetical protein [Myxococcota bacterium]
MEEIRVTLRPSTQPSNEERARLICSLHGLMRALHWLSVDVSVGAALGVLFFQNLTALGPDLAPLCVAAAAMSVYSADHLLDLRSAHPPLSTRRQFHLRMRWFLRLSLLFSLPVGFLLAFMLFSDALFTLGICAAALVGVYLLTHRVLARRGLKELTGAILYCGALLLPSLSDHEAMLSFHFWGAAGLYLAVAWLNLALFTLLDAPLDQAEAFPSLAQKIEPLRLHRQLRYAAGALSVLCCVVILILSHAEVDFPVLCGLATLVWGHALLTIAAPTNQRQRRRQIADLLFWAPGLGALIAWW